MKKHLLLLTCLLFLSVYSFAGMLPDPDNSANNDSIKYKHNIANHLVLTDSIVNYGKVFLKTPYHFGSPGISSFDCSGFTSHVYRNFGYNLEHSSADQAKQFDTIDRTQLKPGDLVFFSGSHRSKKVGHVGIVTQAKENGEFEFIHAAVHKGVTISNSNESYYMKRFVKASRVISATKVMAFSKLVAGIRSLRKDTLVTAPVKTSTQTTRKVLPAKYHSVKSGETLSSISEKYGVPVAELKRINTLKGNKLKLKQRIKVKDEEAVLIVKTIQSSAENPSTNAEQDKVVSQNNNTHSVKKGETLNSISRLYNISVDELKKINNSIKGKLHPGQKLKINQPVAIAKNEALARADVSDKNETPAKNELSDKKGTHGKVDETPKVTTHKVISGESLSGISKTYNVSVDELKKINNISNSNIHAGQELRLVPDAEDRKQTFVAEKPSKKQDSKIDADEKTVTHKVKKGENLGSIAKNNNTTVEELKRINNLSDSKIHQGQVLKINNGVEPAAQHSIAEKSDKKKDAKIESKEKEVTHKIKKGESLISIAKDNNMSVDELKRINNINDSKIKSGQELKLSQTSERTSSKSAKAEHDFKSIQYKVKSGESFYTIAKKYGCTVEDLKDWNSKSGSKIKVGEEIIVHKKANI
ncbi:MAG: LysM peptidoglycan-binding domain-containing protein [Paludibacter sp.]|nr:LysM peptidoglycan-binding domain-containing protein [Paludibacter sp.]